MANHTNHKRTLNDKHKEFIDEHHIKLTLPDISKRLQVPYNAVWKYATGKKLPVIRVRKERVKAEGEFFRW